MLILKAVAAALLVAIVQSKNPEYDHWSNCKAGSWVKFKLEAEQAGQKISIEMTRTLSELTAEKAVIEQKNKTSINGTAQPEQTEKEDVPSGNDPNPTKIEKEGDEEVEVAGKKIKCHWIEGTQGEGKVKFWLTKDVPGGVVKAEMTAPGAPAMKAIATGWEKK